MQINGAINIEEEAVTKLLEEALTTSKAAQVLKLSTAELITEELHRSLDSATRSLRGELSDVSERLREIEDHRANTTLAPNAYPARKPLTGGLASVFLQRSGVCKGCQWHPAVCEHCQYSPIQDEP